MGYDRVQLKLAAKAALRRGDPRPWLVSLVYLLLTNVPIYVLAFASRFPIALAGHYGVGRCGLHRLGGLLPLLVLFLYALAYLFTAVLSVGYRHYAMGLWRGRRTEVRDLFHAVPMAGKVICLYLLTTLFIFLWGLAGLPILLPFFLLSHAPSRLFTLAALLCYAGYFAFFLNRALRYSLAYYVLLDHPDRSARECLDGSKSLMRGRRWELFVLNLSFCGWYLLVGGGVYAVALAGVFVGIFLGVFAHGAASVFFSSLIVLGALLLGLLCAVPLLLWVTPYAAVSRAGFYDRAAGVPPDSPAPGAPAEPAAHFYFTGDAGTPAEPAPPGPHAPPEAGSRTGNYYSGFIRKDSPQDDAQES